MWKDQPLFTIESNFDYKKLSVNQEFLEEIGLRIQEAETIDLSDDKCFAYQDKGHGKTKHLSRLTNK